MLAIHYHHYLDRSKFNLSPSFTVTFGGISFHTTFNAYFVPGSVETGPM